MKNESELLDVFLDFAETLAVSQILSFDFNTCSLPQHAETSQSKHAAHMY